LAGCLKASDKDPAPQSNDRYVNLPGSFVNTTKNIPTARSIYPKKKKSLLCMIIAKVIKVFTQTRLYGTIADFSISTIPIKKSFGVYRIQPKSMPTA